MPTVRAKVLLCSQCGHKWFPRTTQKPGLCPKCKSLRWDRPRKEKRATTSR